MWIGFFESEQKNPSPNIGPNFLYSFFISFLRLTPITKMWSYVDNVFESEHQKTHHQTRAT
jgi:hypothetical protein